MLVLGEDGGDEGAYASFPFGAGYVNYVETIEVIGLIENVSEQFLVFDFGPGVVGDLLCGLAAPSRFLSR